jgi:hypothetical protein
MGRPEHAEGVSDGATRVCISFRQTGPVVERLVEIEFLAAGAEAYCFTFG